MSSYYTRIVRVYEKSKSMKIDADEICRSIQNTAHFEYELIWNENKLEKYLDLKWNSQRAAGDLNLNYDHFDVWEIRGEESNKIFLNEELVGTGEQNGFFFFAFDEIFLEGVHDEMDELHSECFGSYFSVLANRTKSVGNISRIDIKGCYTSACNYEIGQINADNINAVKPVDTKEFLVPRGESIPINNILTNGYEIKFLNRLIDYVTSDISVRKEEFRELKSIKFLWKGRIVNEIFRANNPYDIWNGKNADWWDNCICPEWIEYKIRKEC